MMKRFILLCMFAFSGVLLKAQSDSIMLTEEEEEPIEWRKVDDAEKSRLGIVMGFQLSTLRGTCLPDNRPIFGVLGGAYGRYNFAKRFSLQQAVIASFRGSNFKAGDGEIRTLRFLYLDLPLTLYFKSAIQSHHRFGAGIQYSRLLNTTMYLSQKNYPAGQSPVLDKNDWALLASWQYQFDYFAIQTNIKYGLRNLNLGNEWPEKAKPLNNGGTLQNASLELNIIF